MCSATALASPGDAPPPAPMGPSGSAAPVDPYQKGPVTSPSQTQGPVTAPDTSSPAAPAPSQQQAPAQAPAPNTQQPDDEPQPPASEQKPTPDIDKPAPAPVDQPAPVPKDKQSSRETGSNAPGNVEPNAPGAPGNVAPSGSSTGPSGSNADPSAPGPTASNAPGLVEPNWSSNAPGNVAPGNVGEAVTVEQLGPVIDVENAPETCRDSGKLARSHDRNASLPAKVSFAICTANAALAPLQLVDAEASVNEVDRVTSNSFALLDEVAAAGDPKWAIVALHAQGDLLATMAKRMLATVPANSPAQLRDMRTQMLQPHLQPWLDRAQKAFAEVDQIAKANPRLAKNQVVATAISDSRKRMTTGVATSGVATE